MQTEHTDCYRHRQLEKVAGTNEASGSCHVMFETQFFGRPIGNHKNAIGLYQQRNGNQHNGHGFGQNGLGLEAKQQHHCRQQAHHAYRFQRMNKLRHPLIAAKPLTGNKTGNQRQ